MRLLGFVSLLAIPIACSNKVSTPSPPMTNDGGVHHASQSDTGGSTASGGATTDGMGGAVTGATATGGMSGTGITGGTATTGDGSATDGNADASSGGTRDAGSDASFDARRSDTPDLSLVEAGGTDASPPLPKKPDVLSALRKANDYFLGRWPDPTVDIVTDKSRPSNLWTRAVYFEGLMALYAVEPDEAKKASLYDYAVRWGNSPAHPWTLTYTAAGIMTNNADNQACGQTYIDLYRIDPQQERIATIKANVDDMLSRGTSNVWTWIDAIQMSMPVFARLGAVYSDTRYFDAMWALYNNARTQQGGGLRNATDGLWWRDLHFTPGGGTQQRMTSALHNAIPGSSTDAYIVSPNGKELYWSRGNGWVMAALVRVLDFLPESDSHRATYVADFQSLASTLLPLQRDDGFWNESLLDPSHCESIGLGGQDGPETSGTALFTYGLAWGIRQGLLDGTNYAAPLARAWRGLTEVALQSDGRLGYVQSTGDRPCTDSTALAPQKLANFDDYGVGAFLLAGSEVYRIAN